eukprot:scaffold520702_cov47-Prasinocladus_malaysianus.AAC.1
MGSQEHSMLSMTKQPLSKKKSGLLKEPSQYFSPQGTRNRWYRAESKVSLEAAVGSVLKGGALCMLNDNN